MSNQSTTYVALTTTNAQATGFSVVLFGRDGESKEQVRERAERQICGDQWNQAKDIYVDTELKNLIVVTEKTAQRRYRRAIEATFDQAV